MKIMGRVMFQNRKGAEAAEERLHAAGYEADVCPDAIDVYTSAIFMEVFKDFAADADKEFATISVMDEVDDIVDRHGGGCMEAGVVPDDYIPHSEGEEEFLFLQFRTIHR